VGW
ncbi:hypothetical protein D039_3853B, partial [Vibrio parahaemolyticus EKP-028]|jgi:hypothetical protein